MAYLEAQIEQLVAHDSNFKSELISNPQKAIEHRLKTKLAPKMLAELLEYLRGHFKWMKRGELSDEELAQVAGGTDQIPEMRMPVSQVPQRKAVVGKAIGKTEQAAPAPAAKEPAMSADAFTPVTPRRQMPRSNKPIPGTTPAPAQQATGLGPAPKSIK